MHGVLSKIRAVRDRLRSEGLPDVDLLVDGGVDETTLGLCAGAGANAFVAGTALYRLADMAAGIQRFRQLALDAWKG
jgi:ribulose-phosphate 3-epimerase